MTACVQLPHTVSFRMTQATCVQQTSCITDAACFQQQHSVRSCMSDTATNVYDSDKLSLQTQPEQLTSRLRLEPRTCQVQSSSKDLTLTDGILLFIPADACICVSELLWSTYMHISNTPHGFVSIQISCYLSL